MGGRNPFESAYLKVTVVDPLLESPDIASAMTEAFKAKQKDDRRRAKARLPRKRKQELKTLVLEKFDELETAHHRPTAQEVLKALEKNEDVQDITSDTVFWRNSHGTEKKTKISTVRNWISEERKRPTRAKPT